LSNDSKREKFYLFREQDLLQVFHIFQSENIGQIFDIIQKHSLGQIIDIFQEHRIGDVVDIFQSENIGQIFEIFQKENIGQVIDVFQKLNAGTKTMEQEQKLTQSADVEREQEIAQKNNEIDESENESGNTEDENDEEIFDREENIDEKDNEEENERNGVDIDEDAADDEDVENEESDNEEEEDEQDSDEYEPEISEQHFLLLQQFHDWLSDMENEAETAYDENETAPKIGLYQLYEALIAQQQELKLFIQSNKLLQELFQQSFQKTAKSADVFNQVSYEQSGQERQNAAPFLSSIMEIDESIQRTSGAFDSLRIRLNTFIRDRVETLTKEYYNQMSWWERFRKRKTIQNFVDYVIGEQTNEISQTLYVFQQGFAILVQRMDNVLKKHHLERINPVGKPIDPETMQVIDVAENETIPAGCVADVLRFGYVWQGQTFRLAEVRMAVKG
jgi:molecular chaperone GrpE (heat shock protein)